MGAISGSNVVLKIDDGDVMSASFNVIGGLTLSRVKLSRATVARQDVSGNSWVEVLSQAGSQRMVIVAEGVVPKTAADSRLSQVAFDGSAAQFELQFSVQDVWRGSFVVSDYERTAERGKRVRYRLQLSSAGDVIQVGV